MTAGHVIAGPSINEFGGLAVSPDDSEVAIGYLSTGDLVTEIPSGNPNGALGFSPAGMLVVTGAGSRSYLWNAATGKRISTISNLAGSGGGAEAMAFSPDGKVLAALDIGGDIHLWRVG